MSWLKLAWIPRTTPGESTNPYVNKRIKHEIDRMTKRAEELLAMEPLYALMDEAEKEKATTLFYHGGSNYCSYHVQTGDQARDILDWWRERGYRSISYTDDVGAGSRDYRMESRDQTPLKFSMYVYFKGEECKFEDEVGEDGQKIVDHVRDSQPAKAAEIVYKRKLVCGGSDIPGAEEEGNDA